MAFSFACGLNLPVYAQISGDWRYEIYDGSTATIIGYSGSETEVEIPSELDGHEVTRIGDEAFFECAKLESVTILAL